eukprot:664144-Pelagomonas_calceolata.AAC.1
MVQAGGRLMCEHMVHVLRSRHGTSQRTSAAACVRQSHQLNANQWRAHSVEIKCCKELGLDTDGGGTAAACRLWLDLCKHISGKALTLHTIILGVGETCYNEHIIDLLKKLGLDLASTNQLASLHMNPMHIL